jgi:hypothetical protein
MLLEDVTLLSIAGSPDVRFAALIAARSIQRW